MAYIKNWRDFQPKIAHLSAVHWGGLRGSERGSDDERDRLGRLGGFARHALQGRKTSDHHKHSKLEQVYYILSGCGEVLFDGQRYAVRDGDAVYLPSGLYHQMFNDMNDGWLEHHVISQAIEGDGGDFAISNWRDTAPAGDGEGGLRWRQLRPVGEGGPLRGLAAIDRHAVQPQAQSAEGRTGEREEVYYVVEGRGLLSLDGDQHPITEGDMIHLPPGSLYRLHNPNEDWLACLVMAA